MKGAKPRVVLYNPRAVFYTMPLALLALASALDRDQIRGRASSTAVSSAIRSGVSSQPPTARCVSG